jgi:diguanylate cyclase (GGDEF)-like protein
MPEQLGYIPEEEKKSDQEYSLDTLGVPEDQERPIQLENRRERVPYHLSETDYALLQELSQKELRDLSEREQNMLDLLLRLDAVAAEAYIDELTGIDNRKAFTQEEEREKRREFGEGQTWVFVIDINDFKSFNTYYEHSGGDKVLQHIANHLKSLVKGSVRSDDVALRYAGDEFCVIARGVIGNGADVIASRIYDAIAHNPVEINGKEVPIRIAIGYANVEEDKDLIAAFDRADVALLNQAKTKKQDRDEAGNEVPTIASYDEYVKTHQEGNEADSPS